MTIDEFLSGQMRQKFAWGTHDCCLFAADWVAAIEGCDPAAAIRGTYKDRRGAMRVIRAHGGMAGLVRACLPHWRDVPNGEVADGAVVIYHQPEIGPTTGIRWGGMLFSRALDGVAARRADLFEVTLCLRQH